MRRLKISAGILNVRVHPHPEGTYLELIRSLYKLRRAVQFHGDRYAMLSSLDKSEDKEGIITGTITTFTKIELDGDWFDIQNLKEADEEKVSSIKIPENLFPNMASFYFEFDLKDHKIYVQRYSRGKVFTIPSALRFFKHLCEDERIQSQFGSVAITFVQDENILDSLFKLPIIKQLKIVLLKPNPDIFSDDLEVNIEAYMNSTKSRQVTITLDSQPGESLNLIPELKDVAKAALGIGHVDVKGRDASGAVEKSTQEHPKLIQETFDPELHGEETAFRRMIRNEKARN